MTAFEAGSIGNIHQGANRAVYPHPGAVSRARTLWQASEQVSQSYRLDTIKVIHPAIVTEVRMPRDADIVLEFRCRGGRGHGG